jgi:hypothetical protein
MHPRYRINPKQTGSFWLSAANFYVLAAALAIAAFFLTFGLLREESGEQPWIPAGIAASAVLVVAVMLRRAILRRAQARVFAARQLDRNWRQFGSNWPQNENKLTIERNAAVLHELKRKSEAAMVLARYADGHREVFQLCGQYLEINQREMKIVSPGSPRIAALRRGREIAEEYHRQHMMRWAEIETRSLLEDAQQKTKAAEKVEIAGRALAIVESALNAYPAESRLSESSTAIADFIVKVKVSDLVERAGRAESRGNQKQAEKLYRKALNELGGNPVDSDRLIAAEKIQSELERLANSD